MRSLRRRLAPALAAGVLTLLMAAPALGFEWADPVRVTATRGSGLSSLHELASGGGRLHLAHARLGPRPADDRVVYQRSMTGGATWSKERTVFAATDTDRVVIPNLAVAAAGDRVAVAWRTRGPDGSALWVRRSTDGGASWQPRQRMFKADGSRTIGTPAVAMSGDRVLVAFTDRATGRVLVRRSTDAGATFGAARVMGRSRLSIDCHAEVLDGLVGLASTGGTVHLAWSDAKAGACLSNRLLVRTSADGGATWKPVRVASQQRTYGWPELTAREDLVLATLQRPDGAIVVVRSRDGGRSFTERVMEPADDRAMGAADVLLPGGRTAWLVYADVAYKGDDVAASRIRFKRSTDGGRTWTKSQNVVGFAPRLREATNIAAFAGEPVVAFSTGPVDGSTPSIVAVHAR